MRESQESRNERVDGKPQRRQFTPEYKLKVLQEIDTHREERGAVGEILRREGLYASQVAIWRRDLEEQIGRGVESRKRGPKPDPSREVRLEKEKLERQLRRIQEENRQLRLIVAAQKKNRGDVPRAERERRLMAVEHLVAKGCPAQTACEALGASRETFYRRRRPRPLGPPRPRPAPRNRLSPEERDRILSLLHEPGQIDLSPREIVPRLCDEGIYLGSIRTVYRVLAEHSEVRERRLQARRPAIAPPILEAKGPNEVWT